MSLLSDLLECSSLNTSHSYNTKRQERSLSLSCSKTPKKQESSSQQLRMASKGSQISMFSASLQPESSKKFLQSVDRRTKILVRMAYKLKMKINKHYSYFFMTVELMKKKEIKLRALTTESISQEKLKSAEQMCQSIRILEGKYQAAPAADLQLYWNRLKKHLQKIQSVYLMTNTLNKLNSNQTKHQFLGQLKQRSLLFQRVDIFCGILQSINLCNGKLQRNLLHSIFEAIAATSRIEDKELKNKLTTEPLKEQEFLMTSLTECDSSLKNSGQSSVAQWNPQTALHSSQLLRVSTPLRMPNSQLKALKVLTALSADGISRQCSCQNRQTLPKSGASLLPLSMEAQHSDIADHMPGFQVQPFISKNASTIEYTHSRNNTAFQEGQSGHLHLAEKVLTQNSTCSMLTYHELNHKKLSNLSNGRDIYLDQSFEQTLPRRQNCVPKNSRESLSNNTISFKNQLIEKRETLQRASELPQYQNPRANSTSFNYQGSRKLGSAGVPNLQFAPHERKKSFSISEFKNTIPIKPGYSRVTPQKLFNGRQAQNGKQTKYGLEISRSNTSFCQRGPANQSIDPYIPYDSIRKTIELPRKKIGAINMRPGGN